MLVAKEAQVNASHLAADSSCLLRIKICNGTKHVEQYFTCLLQPLLVRYFHQPACPLD